MIKVIYNKTCGRCVQSEPLTSGMVGQPIHFEYSHDFDGLSVTAVFTDGKNTVDVLNPGNQCVIPHEVLDTVGALVNVGIYATKGNELVIPTIYATIGIVLKGADPSGDVSADPTLPVWAQTQALIGNLNDLTTQAKNNLVAAINEAAQTGGGSTVPENVALLEDVTADEASGDFIPMLSQNGTEYRLSIGDDGIPVIKNLSGATVWTGTSGGSSGGGTGGDSGGGGDTPTGEWVSGAEIAYTLVENEYVSGNDGSFVTDTTSGWDRTELIYCLGAGTLFISGVKSSSRYNVFYDANKQFISNFNKWNSYITVPDTAVYFAVSDNSLDGMVLKLYKNVEPTWMDGVAYSLKLVENEYIDTKTGTDAAYAGWSRTDFINCVGASKIVKTSPNVDFTYMCLYNADKEPYESVYEKFENNKTEITIPAGACYLKISGDSTNMNALVLVPYA